MKSCYDCKQEKAYSTFHHSRNRRDGHAVICKECIRTRFLIWQKNNPEKAAARHQRYRVRHPERLRLRALTTQRKNPARVNANTQMRNARKTKAAPKWLNRIQKLEMKEWYNLAKWMERHYGNKWHVDHIIPLKGKNVSGLHVPWNLQVITADENIKKGNRVHNPR